MTETRLVLFLASILLALGGCAYTLYRLVRIARTRNAEPRGSCTRVLLDGQVENECYRFGKQLFLGLPAVILLVWETWGPGITGPTPTRYWGPFLLLECAFTPILIVQAFFLWTTLRGEVSRVLTLRCLAKESRLVEARRGR